MKKTFKILLVVITFLGLSTLPVKAFGDRGFGLAVGVIGGATILDANGTEREGNSSNSNTATETTTDAFNAIFPYASYFGEVSFRGDYAGLAIGYENSPGAGTIGEGSRTDTDVDTSDDSDTGLYSAKGEVEDFHQAYAELVVYPGAGNVGFFVKGGVAEVDVISLESIDKGAASSAYGNVTIDGTVVGGGVRGRHDSGIMWKLVFEHTDWDKVTLDSTTGNKNQITADLDTSTLKFGIGYQF
tara:strand:+ start:687 stop:1415 length:729 start_codon:yes stop_codon:yes gene_type:complete